MSKFILILLILMLTGNEPKILIFSKKCRLQIKDPILNFEAEFDLEWQERSRQQDKYIEVAFTSLNIIEYKIISSSSAFENCQFYYVINSYQKMQNIKFVYVFSIGYLLYSFMGQQLVSQQKSNESNNQLQHQNGSVEAPSRLSNTQEIRYFVAIDNIPQYNSLVSEIQEKLGDYKPSIIHSQGTTQPKAYKISNEDLIYDVNCEWKDGLPNGFGRLIYKDQSLFVGYFQNGIPQGQGRYISSQGWYYQGEIRREQAEGKGIFCYEKIGYYYEGQWTSNFPNGNGKQTWIKDGKTSSFEGQFINGQKNGLGKYTCQEQWEYEGLFVKNKMTTSKGILKYRNGQVYQGGFIDGKKHGFGIYKWTNGSYFQGWYSQDKKQGHGKFTFNENKIFQGQWRDGKRQGYGILSIGEKMYSGIWQNDKIISKEEK